MRYRSKPTEVEAMQWTEHERASLSDQATNIVAWVIANGGEAKYVPGDGHEHGFDTPPWYPRIAVRTKDGWAYAALGHYVVMGEATFHVSTDFAGIASRPITCRDFYPCDPETFESRWEPQP